MIPVSLGLYRLATWAAEPFAPAILRKRAGQGKEDAARLSERLGRPAHPRPDGDLVWLHGASVGESLSLLPLIERLQHERPGVAILITSGTRTSASLLAQRLPAGVIHQYLPVDGPGAVARFLDHWRPSLGVIAESELWPNLILAAKARGVKLALVSARITEDSAKGWTRAPGAARALLSAFNLILPQDILSQTRIQSLGGRTAGLLNLKFTAEPLPVNAKELARLRAEIGGRKVVLAASTHPGEDGLIHSAFEMVGPLNPPPLLVIAPRHPDRGAAIAESLGKSPHSRRAVGEPISDTTQVYIADTLGEMGLFFSLADVVVMAGCFVGKVGGHNPLEPARFGKPIITGEGVYNFRDVYAEMFVGGLAAWQAETEEDLTAMLRQLLTDETLARRLGEGARAYARASAAEAEAAIVQIIALAPAP